MGKAVNMVPMEDPVAVDTTQVAKNTKATKAPPCTPARLASQTKPPDRPLSFINAENMPMTKKMTITETEVMEEMPEMAASQKRV